MKVFLQIWKDGNKTDQKIIECPELIIKDGVDLDIDGEKCQLFHVIAANGIYHNVASVEVI